MFYARAGDSTFHGGKILLGAPYVLLNNRPVARFGDYHMCPLATPNPHVGGTVLSLKPVVQIGGLPPVHFGSPAICTGDALDFVIGGDPKVSFSFPSSSSRKTMKSLRKQSQKKGNKVSASPKSLTGIRENVVLALCGCK